MNLNVFFQKSWKTMLINGILATIFGIILLFVTNDIIKIIIYWFGITLIAISVVLIGVDISRAIKKEPWGVYLLQSIVFILIGILCINKPVELSKMLYIVFGVWIAITGTFQLITTIQYQKYIPQHIITIICALLLVILGVLIIFYPYIFQKTVTKVVGAFLIVTGLWQIFNAFRFKRICKIAENADIIEDEEL